MNSTAERKDAAKAILAGFTTADLPEWVQTALTEHEVTVQPHAVVQDGTAVWACTTGDCACLFILDCDGGDYFDRFSFVNAERKDGWCPDGNSSPYCPCHELPASNPNPKGA